MAAGVQHSSGAAYALAKGARLASGRKSRHAGGFRAPSCSHGLSSHAFAGSGPLSTQAIMDAITEATTKASSLEAVGLSSPLDAALSYPSASLPPGHQSASSSVSGLVELAQLEDEAGIAPSSRGTSPRQRPPAAAAQPAGEPAAAAAAATGGATPQAADAAELQQATAAAAEIGMAAAQAAAGPPAQQQQHQQRQQQRTLEPAVAVPVPQYVDDFPTFLATLRAEEGLPAAAAPASGAAPTAAAGAAGKRGAVEGDSFGPAGSAQIAEQVAAALNQLLSDIGDGLEKVGQQVGKKAGQAASRTADRASKTLSPLRFELARVVVGGGGAHPAGQQQQQLEAPRNLSAFQQPPGAFAAGAAAATPSTADGQQGNEQQQQGDERPHVQRRRHEPVAAEQQQSLPTPHHLLAVHSTAHGTLPCSPFESMGGPPAEQPSIASSLIRGISQAPAQGSLEPPAGEHCCHWILGVRSGLCSLWQLKLGDSAAGWGPHACRHGTATLVAAPPLKLAAAPMC